MLRKLEAVNEQELSHEESLTLAVVRWEARNTIALQSENDRLNPLRKNFYPTAFTEGWAVYASLLGRELGQYQDLYDLYGHLTMGMMASVRLP